MIKLRTAMDHEKCRFCEQRALYLMRDPRGVDIPICRACSRALVIGILARTKTADAAKMDS